jgi:hypothetical protein
MINLNMSQHLITAVIFAMVKEEAFMQIKDYANLFAQDGYWRYKRA